MGPPDDPTPDTKRLGAGMFLAMWVLVLILLTLVFDAWLSGERNPNRNLSLVTGADGAREVTLQRNRYGHYVASGTINGEPVVFMLDTGASDVSVPGPIAQRLGLKRGPQLTYQTANGLAIGYATVLDRVAIGGIELGNVRASINPQSSDDNILLGMTFLKHLDFAQRGDQLTLRQRP